VPSPFTSCVEITVHAITSAVVERKEQRTKTPYSLNINLITTQLSKTANRCAVNRFLNSLLECPLNTSRCASPLRAGDLSLIFDGLTDIWVNFGRLTSGGPLTPRIAARHSQSARVYTDSSSWPVPLFLRFFRLSLSGRKNSQQSFQYKKIFMAFPVVICTRVSKVD